VKWAKAHPEQVKAKNANWRKVNSEQNKEYQKEYRDNNRLQVISHYSPELKCQCPGCNESHYEFLTIDHVNNNGAAHRGEIGLGGGKLYKSIIEEDFPDDYQVLCYNCNMCKGSYGECYHTNPEIKGNNKQSIKIRHKVLSFYSPKLKCACCGESIYEFLAIDHMYGGGMKHKKEIGTRNIYRWIIKKHYPKDSFRVLCHNCNCSLGHQGYCPHHPEVKQVVDEKYEYGKDTIKYNEIPDDMYLLNTPISK